MQLLMSESRKTIIYCHFRRTASSELEELLHDWGRKHRAKTFERRKEKSVNGLCVWLVLSQFLTSFLVCLFVFSPRHAKNVITCSLTGRPSTTVALVVVESVVNAQQIRNLSQSEAGVRRLCGCVTAALENRRRQLRCSPNRLVTWGNIRDTFFFQGTAVVLFLPWRVELWNFDGDKLFETQQQQQQQSLLCSWYKKC